MPLPEPVEPEPLLVPLPVPRLPVPLLLPVPVEPVPVDPVPVEPLPAVPALPVPEPLMLPDVPELPLIEPLPVARPLPEPLLLIEPEPLMSSSCSLFSQPAIAAPSAAANTAVPICFNIQILSACPLKGETRCVEKLNPLKLPRRYRPRAHMRTP